MKTRTKAAVAVTTMALVLGTGGVALAASPHTTGGHGHRAGSFPRHRIEHGQFVTKDPKTGASVTHEVAGGTVSSVSATAIAVKAADGTVVAFTVSSATKVHEKGHGKHSSVPVTSLKSGQGVLVVGTGTGPYDATFVFAR